MQPEPVFYPPLHPFPAPPGRARPMDVALEVAEVWGIETETLRGRANSKRVREARRGLVLRLRAESGMSFAEIGAFLGGRDHSTIMFLAGAKR
jgi:chromosomal replication initiation ATPase DnaA